MVMRGLVHEGCERFELCGLAGAEGLGVAEALGQLLGGGEELLVKGLFG
jgi:hypothetical protein